MVITQNPITITYVPIPDDNFRNAIFYCIDTNGENTLSTFQGRNQFKCIESFSGSGSDIISGNTIDTRALKSITQFVYSQYPSQFNPKPDDIKIRSLSGIEHMINLNHLNVVDNFITNIDISNIPEMDTLIIQVNRLTSLDLSSNTGIRHFICY